MTSIGSGISQLFFSASLIIFSAVFTKSFSKRDLPISYPAAFRKVKEAIIIVNKIINNKNLNNNIID